MRKLSQTASKLANRANTAKILLVFVGMVGLVAVASAQDSVAVTGHEPVVHVTAKQDHLELMERSAKVIELPSKITRVDGFDESVVKIKALAPNRLHLWAVAQGVTTISLTDENDETYVIETFVKGDVRHLQALINSNFPDASVEALKINDSSVVLRGWVTQPEYINYIVEIAEQFYPQVLNQLRVGGVQQVKLGVKVMEVERSKIRQLGFNFLYLNKHGYFSSTPGQLTQLAETSLPFKPGSPSILFDQDTLAEAAMSFGLIGNHNIFNGFFQALKEEGLLKILAEPNVVTTNGHAATLLSGGEFPILVPQSLGTVTIEWRKFGTSLEAVPIILGNGRLRLELQPEVSERDFTNAVDVQGLTVPGLTTRRVNTQVEMKFGQTFIIGGLIANRRTAETDKIPILGELPWVGAAFRKVRHDDVETELIIMVTPELVAPLDPDQVPAGGPGFGTDAPTDRELYIDGMLEVPNYGACQDPVSPAMWNAPAGSACPHGDGRPGTSCASCLSQRSAGQRKANVAPEGTAEESFPPKPDAAPSMNKEAGGESESPQADAATLRRSEMHQAGAMTTTSRRSRLIVPTSAPEATDPGTTSTHRRRPGLIGPKDSSRNVVSQHEQPQLSLIDPKTR